MKKLRDYNYFWLILDYGMLIYVFLFFAVLIYVANFGGWYEFIVNLYCGFGYIKYCFLLCLVLCYDIEWLF